MREIKFRAWHGIGKTMHYGVSVGDINGRITWPAENNIGYYENNIDGMDVMQFTGLKDKNGKEIYEGDIVNINNEFNLWKLPENGICEVKWMKATGFYPFNLDLSAVKETEIIGNIYQNPDIITSSTP